MYRVLQYIFAVVSVVSMQSIYIKLAGKHLDLIAIFISIITLVLLIIFKTGKKLIERKTSFTLSFLNVMMFLLLSFRILFSQVQYSLFSNLIVTLLFTIYLNLVIYYFSSNNTFLCFLFDISNFIIILSAISLLFFVFGQNLHLIPNFGMVLINWGGPAYVDNWMFLHFNPQGMPYMSFTYGRNTGIFVEAPQYAFILCLGMSIEVFIKKHTKIWKILILLISIYTTLSTTGTIVSIVIILFAWILKVQPRRKVYKILKKMFLFLISFIAAYLILDIYKNKQGIGNSYQIRQLNSQTAWDNFFNNPIIGLGFKSDSIGVGGGNTSTITQSFQEGGIIFGLIYFIPIVAVGFKSLLKKQYNILFFTIVYLILLYPTVMTYTQLSIIMVGGMYSLSLNNKEDLWNY